MSRSRRIARDVWRSLLAHPQRALLMMLGIIIGTATLSAVIVVGQGTRAQVMDLVAKHGMDMIMIRPGGDMQVFAPTADRAIAALVEGDADAIAASVPNVRRIAVTQNQRGLDAVYRDRATNTRVFGVSTDWLDVRRWRVEDGDWLSDADMQAMSRVAILGATVAGKLFPDGGAVGQVIRLGGDPYTVKGVFGAMGANAAGDDWDDRIIVPFTTASRRLFGRPYLEQIVLLVDDPRRVGETAEQIRLLLRQRHRIGPGEPEDFFVREPADVQEAALETSSTLTALLLGISLVALLAGGLVIANVTLLSVSQRTHEIGLRRAVGARASDILRQFLFDSLIVALAGGVIGAILGVALTSALSAAGVASRVTWLPFAVAIGSCAAIGLAAGILPARRAAGIDPAAALRERAL